MSGVRKHVSPFGNHRAARRPRSVAALNANLQGLDMENAD